MQIDLLPERIGLRYPVEVSLLGDVCTTLQTAQTRMQDWHALLTQVRNAERTPLRPQMMIGALSDALSSGAVISLDCGANTHFAARGLMLKKGQRLTGTGLLATMGRACPSRLRPPSRILAGGRSRSSAIAGLPC